MKTKILLLMSLCICIGIQAQNHLRIDKTIRPYDNHWQLEFTTGANFDLTRSTSDPNADLLNIRPESAAMFATRVNHLFAKKWGWYANAQINFYNETDPRGQSSLGNIWEEIIDEVYPGVRKLHPSIDAGVLYRIEKNKFRLYPSLGIGYNGHLSQASSSKLKLTDNGEQVTKYKQDPGYLALNVGITGNYYLSRRGFMVIRASFQQPLQRTSACWIRSENGVETERQSYETWTAGRTLTLSIGYGFAFGKRR